MTNHRAYLNIKSTINEEIDRRTILVELKTIIQMIAVVYGATFQRMP